MPAYEEFDGNFDPHRTEPRTAPAVGGSARLRARGIAVTGTESPEDLVGLLSVVQGFEAAVERFVLRREPGEIVPAYIKRIAEATARLRRYQRVPE